MYTSLIIVLIHYIAESEMRWKYLYLVLYAYNIVGIASTILVGRLADATRRIQNSLNTLHS